MDQNYYVYVYIDPRNLEEFYFGKGTGSRKNAHLSDHSDTEKVKRIEDIKNAGLSPIIRVVARNLTEEQAFLVEATLLWKIRGLTNIASGHFQDKFRPRNHLHHEVAGFDYQRTIHFFNAGQQKDDWRCWDDCVAFGFISAGGGMAYAQTVRELGLHDVVAAYVSGRGFVGIGVVTAEGRPVREVSIGGTPLLTLPIRGKAIGARVESDADCEWVALVDWKAVTPINKAKHLPRFIRRQTRSELSPDSDVVKFLSSEFGIDVPALVI